MPLCRPDSTSPAEPGGEAALQGAAQRATLLDAELSSGDEDAEYEGSAASESAGAGAFSCLCPSFTLIQSPIPT